MLTNILIMRVNAELHGACNLVKSCVTGLSVSATDRLSVALSLRLLFTRELPLATSESAISLDSGLGLTEPHHVAITGSTCRVQHSKASRVCARV